MQVQELIAALDQEIARLRQARELIGGTEAPKRRGRPKGSVNKTPGERAAKGKAGAPRTAGSSASGTRPKRQMSAEGKARIAAAQKARWAAQKAGTSKGTRGATKANASATIDRRTRAGKAAAKGLGLRRKTAKTSPKRAQTSKTPPSPATMATPELVAQS